MIQGKLEVVKQELARMNVDILGISGLKWTGMGEFNSDDHYIYFCGQESLRRNGVAIIANKRVNRPVNLENSSVATGLKKVSFHSNHKKRQCQRMFKLLHNCTHLTHY